MIHICYYFIIEGFLVKPYNYKESLEHQQATCNELGPFLPHSLNYDIFIRTAIVDVINFVLLKNFTLHSSLFILTFSKISNFISDIRKTMTMPLLNTIHFRKYETQFLLFYFLHVAKYLEFYAYALYVLHQMEAFFNVYLNKLVLTTKSYISYVRIC